MVNLIDTHAHLFKDLYPEGNNLKRISEKLKYVFIVSYSLETSIESLDLSKKYNNFYSIIGLHPNSCNDYVLADSQKIKRLVDSNVIAIGEIGLDYYREVYNKENQKRAFIDQLDIAQEFKLPVIIHLRDSDAIVDSLKILKKYKSLKIVLHSWSGTLEQTKKLLQKENYYFSFNGISTFKNANKIRSLIKIIPLNKLFLETDCPWLSPEPYRGGKNNPLLVEEIYKSLSSLIDIPIEELSKSIEENIFEVFKL